MDRKSDVSLRTVSEREGGIEKRWGTFASMYTGGTGSGIAL